jgi:hypothetical protein
MKYKILLVVFLVVQVFNVQAAKKHKHHKHHNHSIKIEILKPVKVIETKTIIPVKVIVKGNKPYTYVIKKAPKYGRLKVIDNVFKYILVNSKTKHDEFEFYVIVGNHKSKTEKVHLNIKLPKNKAPKVKKQKLVKIKAINTTIIIHTTDPENDPVTYSLEDTSKHGMITGSANVFTYILTDLEAKHDKIVVSVSDGFNKSIKHKIHLKIKEIIQVIGIEEGQIFSNGINSISGNLYGIKSVSKVKATIDGENTDGLIIFDDSSFSITGDSSLILSGHHSMIITVTDSKNVETILTVNFTVDLDAPVIVIDSIEDNAVFSGNFILNANYEDALTPITVVSVSLDNVDISNQVNNVNGVITFESSLTDGSHIVNITITDSANNTANKEINFTVDNTPPEITVTSPTATGYFSNSTLNFSGTYVEKNLDTIIAYVDGYEIANLVKTETNYSGKIENLTEGGHTFSVKITDKAGHIKEIDTINFSADITAPTIAITELPNNGLINSGLSLTASYGDLLSGIGSVKVELDGNDVTTDSTIQNGSISYTNSNLVDGEHSIKFTVIDNVENTKEKAIEFTSDKTLPVVVLSKPTNAEVFKGDLNLEGSYSDVTTGIATVTVLLDDNDITSSCF